MLIALAAFRAVGPFVENLGTGEFLDWLGRARDKGLREATIPDIVLERRIHCSNHTLLNRDERVEYIRVLKRTLDRRRTAQDSAT
jgi:hypothetical protein